MLQFYVINVDNSLVIIYKNTIVNQQLILKVYIFCKKYYLKGSYLSLCLFFLLIVKRLISSQYQSYIPNSFILRVYY
jgi:hypothetical protein